MGQEREESQGFFEMLWDCEYCEARGLLGKSQRYCASCGGPQNPSKRYFPEPGQERRVDGHLYEGADRTCPACSSPQSARAKNCTHCGSVLDGAAEVRGVAEAPPVAARPAPRPARPGRRIWLFVVAALAILAGGLIFWRCRTQEAQVVVAAHRWQRTVAIEEFNERQEEAWRNEVPAGAGMTMCRDKERSTKQVEDGEECHIERHDKKDGTFEQIKKCKPKYRSESVMDSWCAFSMRRWRPAGEAKQAGIGLSPQWPADLPRGDGMAALGARRQGTRSETLTLEFAGHGSCDVGDPVWRRYTDGQKLKVDIRRASGNVVCSSL